MPLQHHNNQVTQATLMEEPTYLALQPLLQPQPQPQPQPQLPLWHKEMQMAPLARVTRQHTLCNPKLQMISPCKDKMALLLPLLVH